MNRSKLFAFSAVVGCLVFSAAALSAQGRTVKTAYYSLALTPDGTTIASLSLDSLGKGEFRPSALFPPQGKHDALAADGTAVKSDWQFTFKSNSFEMVNTYRAGTPAQPIVLHFDPEQTHATLLAYVENEQAHLPALLHLPEQGSLRIEVESKQPVVLGYDAHRRGKPFVDVMFPGATLENPRVAYRFTVVDIYPHLPGVAADPRYDGFRRNWLNIFQMNAEDGVLANNSASDPCAFVQHMYSEIAKYTPPLAPGLTAMDLIRTSLDRYLSGQKACGIPYYRPFDGANWGRNELNTITSDSYPSFLIAAGDYVSTTHDRVWLKKSYPGLRKWVELMLATDTNGDGLIKYSASGDSGSWISPPGGGVSLRPSNWWDTIGFGYEDAYSNALAYQALRDMASMAVMNGDKADAARYAQRAAKLKAAYLPAFFNPATGVIAGWRSEDGELHDYYFPWVSGAAVVYGLVPEQQGNAIFDHLLAEMKKVGYTNFEHGIPGDLIPIRKEDYVDPRHWAGGPSLADGSDAFQIYENGSATAAFAYYSVAALYKLGRVHDGDAILFPMLEGYKAGRFDGRGPNGKSYDWQSWDGTPSGYEGFLADCYMALGAAMERPGGTSGN